VEVRKVYGYLWTPVIYLSTVSKLLQALVITYNKTFQALATEEDILLPKPFLNTTPLNKQPHWNFMCLTN
jgi:hypothetical protein